MKKIIGILAALMMCFTLSSCVVTAQADDMYDDVDISLVVTYGTPYYDTEGLLLYYIYRDMFYYPYYYHNRYYFHRYSRPLPPQVYRERYRPIPRDDFNRHMPNVRHDGHFPKSNRNARPNRNNKPRLDMDRPTQRPNNNARPNTNQTRPTPNVRPNTSQSRPTPNINRGGNTPSMGGNRSMAQPRSSTRSVGGHVGGRR